MPSNPTRAGDVTGLPFVTSHVIRRRRRRLAEMNQSEPASDSRQDGKRATGQERRTMSQLPLRALQPQITHGIRRIPPQQLPRICDRRGLEVGEDLRTADRARPHHRRRNGSSSTNGRGGDQTRLSLQGSWGATCLGFPFHGTFRSSRSSRPPSVARSGTTSRTRLSESPVPTRPTPDNASASDPLQRTVTRHLQPSATA
ncbi:hypothetical protein B0T18DRAFT_155620 [Schizothecium vesticola]|uniref:Uncharacterized protein n=1 Tax=Schizothecium vesticola TaxID=314040 RepID=A0AA40EW57_9PEZI|nr:hypothetical protein B0T18DRAFT_155620 [Schizothecium vesticola]